MCWWFLQGLQKGIESGRRKHVHLVDDEHLIFSHLRRYSRLLHKALDMLNTIVAGSIKLKYIQRALLGVVLPTPRGPQKRYACASFPLATAFFSVVVSACCPTTASNDEGRYFLAETIYSKIITNLSYECKVIKKSRNESLFPGELLQYNVKNINSCVKVQERHDFRLFHIFPFTLRVFRAYCKFETPL